ncbi:hypothetical protein EUX98_g7137 [Antrodiella citrinella]|uniref:Arrestin-like N-terminal domain-containing protein n=1 Tax=Antrodiella citrinella TaxID=2447956 RepID=A0A4S4MPR9_9APHY|nr:hypothetical protein EUX98_g7137 [Antrodiella citrinella]
MYGEPDRSAAYSISGHVVISMSSRSSFLQRKHALRLLLRSLVVTFEGQSELLTPETTYSAFRLCAISQELALGGAIELSTEDNDDIDKPCTWNVVFSLTIPGWLPATALFGDVENGGETGTRYALHATARFENADSSSPSSWLSTLCNPFSFASLRSVKAPRCPIQLNRFMSPSYFASSSTSLFPTTNYNVCAEPDPHDENDTAHIPPHILSGLRIVCSLPGHMGTEEDSLPFTLRLRTAELSESDCQRLRVAEFAVDVEQAERYRTQASSTYVAQYPVPPKNQQPPYKPLIRPHPVSALYDLGVAPYPPPRHILTRSFSVMPDEASGQYTLAGDGYIFTQDASAGDNITWYSMSTQIPLVNDKNHDNKDWKSKKRLRASGQSPLFGVSHRLLVTLVCTYDAPDGERISERLNFHVPLRFVQVPPSSPAAIRSSSPSPLEFYTPTSSSGRASPCDFPVASLPYAQTLPAYSQLFDSNGDRKIDYSTPLPLYTPRDVDAKEPISHAQDEENEN